MKKTYINTIKTAAFMLMAFSINQASAQLNPMGSMYFQNQYLANPAFAGAHKGLDLNMGYRKQWTNITGSPTMQTLTADYALTEKAGIGLNVYNDKAGLFKRTRTVASYAYHLPLNADNSKLSFGLSLGFMNERISNEDIHGDPGDASVGNYNERDTYVDGDFGVAYTGSKLSVQAALPNMKSLFKKDLTTNSVDRSTFYSAISYKLPLTGFGLEPKVAYRGVKGFDNILDAGANLSYLDNKISLFGMYHSSKSSTFGVGLNYQSIGFSGMYSTATSALSNYANGNFEISIKANLFK
jgi:type IX secretion system PorP/SprF family membrane protein